MTQLPMPSLQQYMQQQRQQQFWNMLMQVGQGLLSANRQGQPPLRALASGLARGGSAGNQGTGGLLDWMKMRGYEQEQQDWQEKRNREKRQGYARNALSTGRMPAGLDPRTGIDWAAPRQRGGGLIMADEPAAFGQPGQQQPSLTPEQLARLQPPAGLLGRQGFGGPTERQGLLSEAYPKAYGRALIEQEMGVAKPPTVREFKEGARVVTKRWEPTARQWVDMATAPRFKPGERGDLTLAQQANNAEIDQARASLDRRGLDKAEIQRRTQKALNTGRPNPEYDDDLGRVVRMATQRKTGNDPDYQRYFRTYLGGLEFSEPAGMRPLPPGVSAEEPGFLDQARDFLGFGTTSQPNPPGAGNEGLSTPRARGPRGRFPARGRGSAKPIPQMSITEIDDLINTRGDSLLPAELKAVQARLAALGIR